LDNGSGYMKAGIATEEYPSQVFKSVVGTPKYASIVSADVKSHYIGDDAIAKRSVLDLVYPVKSGRIENWDYMTKVWDWTFFNMLRMEPSERPVHITEAPKNPKKNKEKMIEVFFENYQVPSFYVSIQAMLGLYSTGRTSGLVYDSGDGVTHMVPIFEGFSIKHAVKRLDLAGRDLTDFLMDILRESGVTMEGSAEYDITSNMKEKCYVALDYQAELAAFEKDKSKEIDYELPDGSKIVLGTQQFQCPELLFNPKMKGRSLDGVHKALHDCVQLCDIDMRREMYNGVVLSGGSTMFPGIGDRLEKELKLLAAAGTEVKIVSPEDRRYSVWIGGSTLSGLASFQTMWITKSEYEETGVNVVHRKCFS
jgi:actin